MGTEYGFTLIVLEIIAIILDLALGILLARKTVSTKRGYTRAYYFGVAGFFFTHALYVLMSLLADLTNIVLVHDLGVFFVLSSLVSLVAAIEHTMYTRTRHVFTIIGCIALGVIMVDVVYPISFPIMRLMVWIQFFLNPTLVAFILVNYIAAARETEGAARRNVFLIACSISLFAIGELSEFPYAGYLIPAAEVIGEFLTDVAIVMMYVGLMRLNIRKDRPAERGGIMNIDPAIRVLKDIWIIRREGTVLFHRVIERDKDEQLFGSLMSAAESFASRIRKGGLSSFKVGRKLFVIRKERDLIFLGMCTSTASIEKAKDALILLSEFFIYTYAGELQDFKGDVRPFKDFEKRMQDSMDFHWILT